MIDFEIGNFEDPRIGRREALQCAGFVVVWSMIITVPLYVYRPPTVVVPRIVDLISWHEAGNPVPKGHARLLVQRFESTETKYRVDFHVEASEACTVKVTSEPGFSKLHKMKPDDSQVATLDIRIDVRCSMEESNGPWTLRQYIKFGNESRQVWHHEQSVDRINLDTFTGSLTGSRRITYDKPFRLFHADGIEYFITVTDDTPVVQLPSQ